MFMSKVSSLHRQSKSTYLPLEVNLLFSLNMKPKPEYRNLFHQSSYSIQFLMSSLFQIMIGRFTVDGVNHHLTRSYLFSQPPTKVTHTGLSYYPHPDLDRYLS